MVQRVDAFNIKAGPTESGVNNYVAPTPVGGEILPFNLFESTPIQLAVLLILMIPVAILVYKKRDLALNLVSRLFI
ncbi:MAG: hypothetical protein ACLFVP_08335 [Candidatus Bathyarchaeia archaeon]